MEVANNGCHTPLITASMNGNLDLVRYLLQQGADKDKASIGGWTSLHWVADRGRLDIAMLLMSYGADLHVRSHLDLLPLDVALTEEMKRAIRDEPRRRMDHGHKRATEQDRHPNAATAASALQEDEEEEGDGKE